MTLHTTQGHSWGSAHYSGKGGSGAGGARGRIRGRMQKEIMGKEGTEGNRGCVNRRMERANVHRVHRIGQHEGFKHMEDTCTCLHDRRRGYVQ